MSRIKLIKENDLERNRKRFEFEEVRVIEISTYRNSTVLKKHTKKNKTEKSGYADSTRYALRRLVTISS